MNKLLLVFLTLMLSTQVFAKRFANGYIEFELPPGWQCQIEGSEWVCQSDDANRKKEAIIILAAKKRGKQDNLQGYKQYLEQTKTYKLPGGKIQKSEMRYAKMNTVNGQSWVDSLHLASEIPGFFTRYLATVKSDIGVAVTFSVTKSLYSAYKGIFDNVIASMRVFREAKVNLAGLKLSGKGGSKDTGAATFVPDDGALNISAVEKKKRKKKSEDSGDLILFALIGLAVAGGIAFKFKKKG